eukprot:6298282-Prymnesium_polylepis.1
MAPPTPKKPARRQRASASPPACHCPSQPRPRFLSLVQVDFVWSRAYSCTYFVRCLRSCRACVSVVVPRAASG